MKLCNIASIDPAITSSGRKGLGNASALDREVWDEFHADWDRLATECLHIHEQLRTEKGLPTEVVQADDDLENTEDFTGEIRRVVTEQRIRQNFFRRAVLSSYHSRCNGSIEQVKCRKCPPVRAGACLSFLFQYGNARIRPKPVR